MPRDMHPQLVFIMQDQTNVDSQEKLFPCNTELKIENNLNHVEPLNSCQELFSLDGNVFYMPNIYMKTNSCIL